MAQADSPAPVVMADALAEVRRRVAQSGSSFLWGMRVLPQERRDAMYAIYAFCRDVDDIADEPRDLDLRQQQLDDWRAEIDRLYAGQPTYAISRALDRPIAAFGLPREAFLDVIDGMEMDLHERMRAPSMAELERYCRRVAGAVGLLSIRVFGADEPEAPQIAVALGEALQLTNILRDLHEDAQRGRLYLPRELLDAHAIATREPLAVLAHPQLSRACAALAQRARQRFAETRRLLERCDRRRLKASILMMEVYERILDRLEQAGWHNPEKPVRLSRFEKLWIVLRHTLA